MVLPGVKDYAEYVYDAQNRLGSIKNSGGATVVGFGYDLQGNLQNKNGQMCSFDYGNRLREVDGTEWFYRYDGQGRRVLSGRADGITVSMYSQVGQLLYYEQTGKGNFEQIYLGGSLLAIRNSGVIKFQHTDALGSPTAVTDTAGAVIERNDYEPYGAIIGKPTYDAMGFTGHKQDGATSLTYMQQRYYDPTVGRFLSVDPVTALSSPVGMFNRYKYAANNPYRFVDPDGRASDDPHRRNSDMRSMAARPSLSGRVEGGTSDRVNSSDHSRVAYNKPPPDTVPATGDNGKALNCVANCTGLSVLNVNGAAEKDGHSRNSAHYDNRAVDIAGPPFNRVSHERMMVCAPICGYTHGGWEVRGRFYADGMARSSIYKDHWHFQIGAKGNVPELPIVPAPDFKGGSHGSRMDGMRASE
jgi:RHS repeat-associated protein